MKLPNKATFLLAAMLASLTLSSASYAGKIYMWYTTDERGQKVPKYGETPPMGVEAVLISETKDTQTNANAPSTPAAAQDENLTEEQKQMRAEREKECDAEQSRLATLQNSGSRIRMANPDGSSRYLTPDEIIKEIEMSKSFLKDACGR